MRARSIRSSAGAHGIDHRRGGHACAGARLRPTSPPTMRASVAGRPVERSITPRRLVCQGSRVVALDVGVEAEREEGAVHLGEVDRRGDAPERIVARLLVRLQARVLRMQTRIARGEARHDGVLEDEQRVSGDRDRAGRCAGRRAPRPRTTGRRRRHTARRSVHRPGRARAARREGARCRRRSSPNTRSRPPRARSRRPGLARSRAPVRDGRQRRRPGSRAPARVGEEGTKASVGNIGEDGARFGAEAAISAVAALACAFTPDTGSTRARSSSRHPARHPARDRARRMLDRGRARGQNAGERRRIRPAAPARRPWRARSHGSRRRASTRQRAPCPRCPSAPAR